MDLVGKLELSRQMGAVGVYNFQLVLKCLQKYVSLKLLRDADFIAYVHSH